MSTYEFVPPNGCLVERMLATHPLYHPRFPYRTTSAHEYKSEHVNVRVPADFTLDFASVPRALWWLFPRDGDYMRAAMFHDMLYRQQKVSREFADAIFIDIMTHDKVPFYYRYPLYWSVRLFGGFAWNMIKKRGTFAVRVKRN